MPGRAHRQSLRVPFLILYIFGQRSGRLPSNYLEASNPLHPFRSESRPSRHSSNRPPTGPLSRDGTRRSNKKQSCISGPDGNAGAPPVFVQGNYPYSGYHSR